MTRDCEPGEHRWMKLPETVPGDDLYKCKKCGTRERNP